jgi:S1-C subfamily serine protease
VERSTRSGRAVAIVIAICIFILGAVLGAALSSWTGHSVFGSSHEIPVYVTQPPAGSTQYTGMGFAPVLKAALPAVVSITSSRLVKAPQMPFFQDPFFQQFFGGRLPRIPQQQREMGLGLWGYG